MCFVWRWCIQDLRFKQYLQRSLDVRTPAEKMWPVCTACRAPQIHFLLLTEHYKLI
uniref:Uncharacterized protein n=1 Tax=Anguilla anguilla TaxID=7936 RepID=A0A0E9X7F2_ANGAN